MKHIRVFILLITLIVITLNSGAQTVEFVIANWEDIVPVPASGPGVWQYFTPNGASEIITNPVPDEINPTQNVLAYYRPLGEWLLTGFYYMDGIPIIKNMTGIEFKIYGESLVKCYAKLIGVVDGVEDQTIIENVSPWTVPSGVKVWNTIILPIDGDELLNDTLTTILIFPNPQLPEASQDTFYIDEVRFLITLPVDSVILNINKVILEAGESIYLESTIFPMDASNQNISWSSTNTGVATVSSIGKVHATGAGNADIIVTSEDGNKTDTCHITVHFIDGIAENLAPDIKLWPNPYHDGDLVLYLPEIQAGDIRLTFYNLVGNIVYSATIRITGNMLNFQPQLQGGMYLIKVESGENIWYGRIIKN